MTYKIDIRSALETATFLIGPEKIKFVAHKQFVCYASPPLKAAFNSPFQEGITQTFEIPNTKPAVFDLWMQWIYQPHVQDRASLLRFDAPVLNAREWDNPVAAPEIPALIHAEFCKNVKLTIDLWGLAEYLMMPKLQNDALSLMVGMVNTYRATRSFPFLVHLSLLDDGEGGFVAGGGRGQTLRRFCIDLIAVTVNFGAQSQLNFLDTFSLEDLVDILAAVARIFGTQAQVIQRRMPAANYFVSVN